VYQVAVKNVRRVDVLEPAQYLEENELDVIVAQLLRIRGTKRYININTTIMCGDTYSQVFR
jgi:hypothetical protein